jgi:hypothetical protein
MPRPIGTRRAIRVQDNDAVPGGCPAVAVLGVDPAFVELATVSRIVPSPVLGR